MSENYIDEKKEKLEKLRQENEKAEILKNKKMKEEIQSKLPQIEKRQIIAEKDFINLQRQKELKREEELEKKNKLNKIIESLKVRPNVESDLDRVKQITEALKIRYETKRDETDKVVLFNNPGFTIDNLMSDMRYKISTALSEAGIVNSVYSNNLLKKLSSNNIK